MAGAHGYRDEAVGLLQALLRLDTVNPPGNETRAAEHLAGYLEGSGLDVRLYARDPARANLVARLPGRGDGPTLLLLSHTDTVVADPSEWTVSPWSGALRDGCVWGRGALDMKGQVAASAVAIATLAREGFRGSGDLVFAATADEEVGEHYGLSWLCEAHPDAVRADFAVNEGGGDRVVVGGRPVYLCTTAEKRICSFRLRVRGRSGHASMPSIADNALLKAAPLIERLGALRPEPVLVPELAALLAIVYGEAPSDPHAALELAGRDPILRALAEPAAAMTVCPTMASASRQVNVVPARCDVVLDCRLLPGQTPGDAEAQLAAALGPGEWELELLSDQGGTRSPAASPLWDAISDWIAAAEPGAVAAPLLMAGFTDSHWLREAFGTVAYGFFPLRAMEVALAARLVHSADERIAVDDLELGVGFLRDVASAMLSA